MLEAYGRGLSKGTLFRNIHSKSPIMPLLTEKVNEKPIIIHRIDRTARPEKHCIITDIAFLLRSNPASKKPNAGIIIITNPVEISIQAVSPLFISDS